MEFSALKLRNRRTISAFSCAFRAIPASASARAGVQQDQKDLEHGADDVDKKQPVPVRREVQTQTAPQMISEQAKICESWLLQSAQKTCATIPEMGMP